MLVFCLYVLFFLNEREKKNKAPANQEKDMKRLSFIRLSFEGKNMEETTFDTDLEDEEEEKDRKLPALSFEKKLTVHRTNRLNELFGQMTILPSIRCHSPSNAGKSNEEI